jgi:hypothetical protein
VDEVVSEAIEEVVVAFMVEPRLEVVAVTGN